MENWEIRQTKIAELQSIPEYKLWQRLQLFDDSIYIFQVNFAELEKLLSAVALSQGSVGEYAQPDGSLISKPFSEMLRLLHNYFAAAKTLVDHARKFYNEIYGETGRFPDYLNRIEEDFGDHLSCFVQDFRNYCQHYKLPAIVVNHPLIIAEGYESRNSIVVRPEALAKFDGWKAKSKEFIEAHERERVPIDLFAVSTQYHDKVTAFYQWFKTQQSEIHEEEFARLKQAENEFHSLL